MLITLAMEVFSTISVIGYSLAALCLVLSVAIFFLFDIRGVYAFLTGKKRQKGISEMRNRRNDKTKKPDSPSIKFGQSKGLNKGVHSAPVVAPPTPQPAPTPAPEPAPSSANDMGTAPLAPPAPPVSEEATGVLEPTNTPPQEGATDVLSPTNTPQPERENDATSVLSADSDNNTNASSEPAPVVVDAGIGSFVLVKNEMTIHTDEIL
ncbi:MAG: hypothetical protein IJS03_05125 [Eubacterium sp.]|nr:hypothetical protein [Eubacterium sp.]